MDYVKNYARCCREKTNFVQKAFIDILGRKAREQGQKSHKIWSLKYVIDEFFEGGDQQRVMDCGAWKGWFLRYLTPAIKQRIALEPSPYNRNMFIAANLFPRRSRKILTRFRGNALLYVGRNGPNA